MRQTSLVGMLAGRLVGLVLIVVFCAVALHWAYELVRPMLWLLLVIAVAVAGVMVARRWSRFR